MRLDGCQKKEKEVNGRKSVIWVATLWFKCSWAPQLQESVPILPGARVPACTADQLNR